MPMLAMVVLVVSGCLPGATESSAEAASHGLAHPPVAIEKQIEFVDSNAIEKQMITTERNRQQHGRKRSGKQWYEEELNTKCRRQ